MERTDDPMEGLWLPILWAGMILSLILYKCDNDFQRNKKVNLRKEVISLADTNRDGVLSAQEAMPLYREMGITNFADVLERYNPTSEQLNRAKHFYQTNLPSFQDLER